MKKMSLIAGVLFLAVACNAPAPVEQKVPEKAAINPADYPYTLEETYKDWQAGNQENAILVLKMVKAWETKNVVECASYFADTVMMNMDFFSGKMPNDSIRAFVESGYANNESIKVEMKDWESVVSADGKDEWVTLWYTQTLVDKDGKSETMNVVNDAKIENGKIAVFDEYLQHLPMKKE
jgi:hypothetical protein